MPQNNVLPDWRATYPNDAPAQKPGGVTVATTATAPRVPNKFTYAAGTIQMVGAEATEAEASSESVVETEAENVVETEEEPTPTRSGRGRRR
jgi:hypothetical protein